MSALFGMKPAFGRAADPVILQPAGSPDLCLQLWGCQVRSWKVDEAVPAVGLLESHKDLVALKNPVGM